MLYNSSGVASIFTVVSQTTLVILGSSFSLPLQGCIQTLSRSPFSALVTFSLFPIFYQKGFAQTILLHKHSSSCPKNVDLSSKSFKDNNSFWSFVTFIGAGGLNYKLWQFSGPEGCGRRFNSQIIFLTSRSRAKRGLPDTIFEVPVAHDLKGFRFDQKILELL